MSILILLVILEECFQIFTIECVASCGFATYDTYFVEVCFNYCNKNMLSAVLSCSAVSISLRPHGLQPARLLCLWDSSGKNTGVGCHALLQGIFLTQGLNSGLLHCRQTLYHLNHQGSQICLENALYFKIFLNLFLDSHAIHQHFKDAESTYDEGSHYILIQGYLCQFDHGNCFSEPLLKQLRIEGSLECTWIDGPP